MVIELHCPCGCRAPIPPADLPAAKKCPRCGATLEFAAPVNGEVGVRLLLVGGSKGPPRLAVPVPMGIRLTIGRGAECWLTLPGEEVEERHAELMLQDARVRVKHLGRSGATWINRARIAEGVLRENDTLAIGPYRLRLGRQAELDNAAPAILSEGLNEGPEDEPEADEEAAHDAVAETPGLIDEQAPRQTLRWTISIAATVGAMGFLGWWWLAPRFSSDMPSETVYRCPGDGTVFRAEWRSGPPKCPQCGALCLGSLRYKSESSGTGGGGAAPPGSQPVVSPAATSQRGGGK